MDAWQYGCFRKTDDPLVHTTPITEENAAAAWGDRSYSIPCRTSCFALGRFEEQDELHQDDLKERDEFILFFKIVLGKIACAARNCINSAPQTAATTFSFSSVYILLLWLVIFTTAYTLAPCGDKLQLVFINLLTGVHCTDRHDLALQTFLFTMHNTGVGGGEDPNQCGGERN